MNASVDVERGRSGCAAVLGKLDTLNLGFGRLQQLVAVSAQQIAERVRAAFPAAQTTFEPTTGRQGIVDSWPAALDDSMARTDWGWSPQYDADRAFNEYLFPTIRQQYAQET
mgnify:CR=1 FL=1